jgi:hypothetical protein
MVVGDRLNAEHSVALVSDTLSQTLGAGQPRDRLRPDDAPAGPPRGRTVTALSARPDDKLGKITGDIRPILVNVYRLSPSRAPRSARRERW